MDRRGVIGYEAKKKDLYGEHPQRSWRTSGQLEDLKLPLECRLRFAPLPSDRYVAGKAAEREGLLPGREYMVAVGVQNPEEP